MRDIVKKILKKVRRVWIKINDILGYGAGILYFVLVLGTIFITLQAIAFCYVYLSDILHSNFDRM